MQILRSDLASSEIDRQIVAEYISGQFAVHWAGRKRVFPTLPLYGCSSQVSSGLRQKHRKTQRFLGEKCDIQRGCFSTFSKQMTYSRTVLICHLPSVLCGFCNP